MPWGSSTRPSSRSTCSPTSSPATRNPADAGRAAPRRLAGGRGAGAAREAGRRDRRPGPAHARRSQEFPQVDLDESAPARSRGSLAGLVFLDTGLEVPTSAPRAEEVVRITEAPPPAELEEAVAPADGLILPETIPEGESEEVLGLEPAGGMDMGGAELIATGFDDDLGLQPTEEATPEFGGELLAGIEEPLATAEEEPLLGDDADLDDMALDLVETETAETSVGGRRGVAELQDESSTRTTRRSTTPRRSPGVRRRRRARAGGAGPGARRVRARRGLRRRRRRGGSAGRARARRDPTPPEAGRAGVPKRRAGAAGGGVSRSGRLAGTGRSGRQGGGRLHPGAGARPRQRAGGGGVGEAGYHARAPSSPTRRPAAPAAPAAEAASAPAPPPPEPPKVATAGAAGADFVDFASMVLDETGPRDTRMRVDRREPEGDDEQREFQEILEQFKRGIDQNIEK